ncbi:hypothetical protein RR42_s1048 [Cupriavidus basilensis]|uniref:Uncharacterized protein n=1 Tax=Cupriavidus basilensis TaxID=68895 RepID=A0A0C4YAU7_9BURK|nr:hypothetical protein RR42_s1048 [Cupriavidus basilensis]
MLVARQDDFGGGCRGHGEGLREGGKAPSIRRCGSPRYTTISDTEITCSAPMLDWRACGQPHA